MTRSTPNQSTTWEVRQVDGTETVADIAGSPLAIPELGALMHLLFAGRGRALLPMNLARG